MAAPADDPRTDNGARRTGEPAPASETGAVGVVAGGRGGRAALPRARALLVSTSTGLLVRYRLLLALRRSPDNRSVRLRDAVAPWLARGLGTVPGVRAFDQRVRRLVFERDLRLLNDALSSSALSGRYWVWGGMLLGWAREGRLLTHDLTDADFAYMSSDERLLHEAIPVLEQYGFRRGFCFESNRSVVTEHTFVRHGTRFEFFAFAPEGDDWRYSVYGPDEGRLVELEASLPSQPLEEFCFLGRRWLKVRDHEREFEVLYGNWRVPDPNWNYLDVGGVVSREPWIGRPAPRRTGTVGRLVRTGGPRSLQQVNRWAQRVGLAGH